MPYERPPGFRLPLSKLVEVMDVKNDMLKTNKKLFFQQEMFKLHALRMQDPEHTENLYKTAKTNTLVATFEKIKREVMDLHFAGVCAKPSLVQVPVASNSYYSITDEKIEFETKFGKGKWAKCQLTLMKNPRLAINPNSPFRHVIQFKIAKKIPTNDGGRWKISTSSRLKSAFDQFLNSRGLLIHFITNHLWPILEELEAQKVQEIQEIPNVSEPKPEKKPKKLELKSSKKKEKKEVAPEGGSRRRDVVVKIQNPAPNIQSAAPPTLSTIPEDVPQAPPTALSTILEEDPPAAAPPTFYASGDYGAPKISKSQQNFEKMMNFDNTYSTPSLDERLEVFSAQAPPTFGGSAHFGVSEVPGEGSTSGRSSPNLWTFAKTLGQELSSRGYQGPQGGQQAPPTFQGYGTQEQHYQEDRNNNNNWPRHRHHPFFPGPPQ